MSVSYYNLLIDGMYRAVGETFGDRDFSSENFQFVVSRQAEDILWQEMVKYIRPEAVQEVYENVFHNFMGIPIHVDPKMTGIAYSLCKVNRIPEPKTEGVEG
jgi:hypothetical protein